MLDPDAGGIGGAGHDPHALSLRSVSEFPGHLGGGPEAPVDTHLPEPGGGLCPGPEVMFAGPIDLRANSVRKGCHCGTV